MPLSQAEAQDALRGINLQIGRLHTVATLLPLIPLNAASGGSTLALLAGTIDALNVIKTKLMDDAGDD